jgi:hypothetical protein
MKLMDKIRSTEARERDARDARHRAAREHAAHDGNRLSTADLAGMESRPVDTRTADATRDDLAHARAARDDERRIDTRDDRRRIDEVAREDARRVDEPAAPSQARPVDPAGKLSDADVQHAVEVSRRDPRAEPDRTGADARVTNARVVEPRPQTDASHEERLAPLFSADVAQGFRARWDATQIGFVDDPRQAVQQADELVAQVMKSLAQSFADERRQLEAQMKETASTENLRLALQRYRSFFQRLLSL